MKLLGFSRSSDVLAPTSLTSAKLQTSMNVGKKWLFENKDSIKIGQNYATNIHHKQFFVPKVESNYIGAIETLHIFCSKILCMSDPSMIQPS